MPKTYSQWRQKKLVNPERAARYLNAAYRESRKEASREAFLYALKNVIQANQVTKIAKEVGVTRESVYRSFSANGNPAFYMIDAVLERLNICLEFNSVTKTSAPSPPPERISSVTTGRKINKEKLLIAAKNMDWLQVVSNGGPPCFALEDDKRFCGRAQRWEGHGKEDHPFVSLEELLKEI